MESIGQVMSEIIANGEDCNLGLCSKCGSKQYTELEILGTIKRMPSMCECRKEEYYIRKEKEENMQKQLRLERLFSNSLMDKRFRDCTFDNYKIDKDNEKNYVIARNYCENWIEMREESVGLMFCGNVGNGKTYTAFSIANELLRKYISVMAISSIAILNKIKENYNKYGKECETDTINSFKNAELLIIDDLGAEYNTQWAKEKIYEIIDSRYRSSKPLIITTNLSIEELKNKYDDDGISRTYDRIQEMCIPVVFKGESLRGKIAKSKQDKMRERLLKID